MVKKVLIACFLMISVTSFSQRVIDSKFGKGIFNVISADSSWSMKFGLRIQSLYVGNVDMNDNTGFGDAENNFLIRRARLKFGGFAFSPKFTYKIELGLSQKDLGKATDRTNFAPRMILDAVVKWNFYKNFSVWAGQTKLPGNRERVISSANLQFVDRSMLNSGYNIDRDIGLQLRHHFTIGKSFLIREIFSFAQGEGRNLVQANLGGMQYTGRLEFLPFGKFASKGDYVGSDIKREEKPKLAIGVTYDYNERAVKDRSNQGSYMMFDRDGDGENDSYFQSNITTVFADLMFKWKGFSFMGEFALRDADNVNPTALDDAGNIHTGRVKVGTAMNLQAGYLFKKNWEVAARYTGVDARNYGTTEQQIGLGISKYVVGHALKVQADVNYTMAEGSPDKNLMYRLQIDLHF
ncbi:MAG: porin [Crocinitomicaceae bacterium]|nr:porin [Crocinitomicaceae bacterium]